jgi:hypothetical protein
LVPAALVAMGCASIDEDSGRSDAACKGIGCQPLDAGKDQFTADVAVPDGASDGGTPPTQNPLCGVGCSPDKVDDCASFVPPASDAGAGDGGAGDAGAAAADSGPAPEAGVSEGGPSNAYGCFVRVEGSGPVAECALSGSGSTGAPCVSARDCAAGFACVGEGSAAQCRMYCCAQDPKEQNCEDGSYCADRTLRDEKGPSALKVPVCVQADNCDLDEPYPCPSNKKCTCKDGTACAVVQSDGTTSCIVPGNGYAGDACPCAPGHVCAKATNSCLKLCKPQAGTSECGSGKCQGASYLPDGFGVCVLTAADGG